MALLDNFQALQTPNEQTEICLPPFGPCDPTGGGGGGGGFGGGGGTNVPSQNPYFTDCGSTYNSSRCGNDVCWYMPIEDGDVISFQNNTISGQSGVTVTDLDGGNIPGSTSVVLTNPEGGQTISVTVPDGTDCFQVTNQQFDSFPPVVGDVAENCLAWEYKRLACNSESVRIRGIYKDGEEDCFGFIYPHDNSIRLKGYLVEGRQSTITKTRFAEKIKRRQVESEWTLYINDIVPGVIHRVLCNQLLAANQVEITTLSGDTYTFETEDTFTISSADTGSRMFHYEDGIPLKLICIVPGLC